MPIEREIKFAIETLDEWRRLSELTSIGSFRLTPARRVRMIDAYADTKDAVVEEAGYAFRIREVDDRFIAGLKRLCPADDGRHFRDEFEQIVADQAAHPSDWSDGVVRRILTRIVGTRPIHVHTRLDLTKLKRKVWSGNVLIGEWSLDEIRFPDRDPHFLLREIEVELKPDDLSTVPDGTAALDEIADLLADFGLRRLSETKLDRARAHQTGSKYDKYFRL